MKNNQNKRISTLIFSQKWVKRTLKNNQIFQKMLFFSDLKSRKVKTKSMLLFLSGRCGSFSGLLLPS